MLEQTPDPRGANPWLYSTIGLIILISIAVVGYLAYFVGKRSGDNTVSATITETNRSQNSSRIVVPSPTVDDDKLSDAFTEKGRRAYDSIGRLPTLPTVDDTSPADEARYDDADKAVDEAKYVSETSRDKVVLDGLQKLLLFKNAAKSHHLNDPTYKLISEGMIACKVEVQFEIEPDSLSKLGVDKARQKSCKPRMDAYIASLRR